MFKTSLLVAVTVATLVTGHGSRALADKLQIKGQTVEVTDKTANALLCRAKWKELNAKTTKTAAENQAIEYGSQYFVKICKRQMALSQ
jgi:hypothetical protein